MICRRGSPRDVVAELEASWVTLNPQGPMRGYACLVFRRHAIELHDLTELEGAAFMRDIRLFSAALQSVTEASKINYEVHGNRLPHLHMHFYPRYPGDPFEGRPIDQRLVRQPVYAAGEHSAMKSRLTTTIRRLSG